MQVKVSPYFVALLDGHEEDQQKDVLSRLWREIEKQAVGRKELSKTEKPDMVAPKRARFSFD